MESVSGMVKRMLDGKPFLLEALGRGILSYGSLADDLKPGIEHLMGREIKDSAIIMALRRYSEEIRDRLSVHGEEELSCEILMKTNICDFNVAKTPELLNELKQLYELVSLERGDFLNVIIGNHEVSIAVSEKYRDEVRELFKGEEILRTQDGLVSLTLLFSGDFFNTPGIIFQAVRRLAWENINMFEIVSTMTELTVIIRKEDSIKGYEVLQQFIERPHGG